MKNGKEGTTFTRMTDFWVALSVLQFAYCLFSFLKYFSLNIVVLNSNELIHEQMIHGILRSPASYFDITLTGKLNNKFSSDLGIMDNMLGFVLIDSIQGVIGAFSSFGNVFSIDLYFLIPGVLNIIFIVYFFIYCKDVIIAVKQLDLKLKNPIFSMIG